MQGILIVRAVFLIIPLTILAWWLIRLRPLIRVPLGIIVGAGVAFAAAAFIPTGDLAFLVTFSTMAGIYAVLSLGLNSQWGLAGHPNFGVAGFFAVGAFTEALFTTAMPTGVLAQYSKQAFGLDLPFLV
ncbi:MAG: ABC transporter permease subunit, partial [Acetobacteraceae bacterium]